MMTARISISIDKNAEKEILGKIDAAMDDLVDFAFEKSQELCPVDEATLKKSGHIEREFLKKTIIYDTPYATYIEFGTRPHFPPVKPLQEWAKRVLRLSDAEAKSAGWAIAKKISERGTEPQPFLRPAIDYTVVKAEELFRNRLR